MSKTVAPMNVKFCRVLETPLNVLIMLKLFTWFYLVTIATPQKRGVWGKITRFQPKIPIIQIATNFTILKITL